MSSIGQSVLDQTQSAVKEILNILKISRVINIDDVYSSTPEIEDIIAAAIKLDKDDLIKAIPEFDQSVPDDPDMLGKKLRSLWKDCEPDRKDELASQIFMLDKEQNGDTKNDIINAHLLKGLIPQEMLSAISPSEWVSRKQEFLADIEGTLTLFLFDQDLSNDGGDIEGGVKHIAELLSGDSSERLICGLLSRHVNPENQFEQWSMLSSKYDIRKDRFVIIPKQYLNEDQVLFAQALKFAALCPIFDKLKQETKAVIKKSAEKAFERIEEINIFDLDHIVFQIPKAEGLWEPDMLFRLHSLYHRMESRKMAHEEGELESLAAKLRALSGIPMDISTYEQTSNSWQIQHDEIYEPPDHINTHYLPIEIGDIFEKSVSDNNKKYILLTQPCDLMVRPGGTRGPGSGLVPLLEVVIEEPNQDTRDVESEDNDLKRYREELPYWGNPNERWYVKLKSVHFVPIYILDLCAMNTEGTARIVIDEDSPDNLQPTWRDRYSEVKKIIRRKQEKVSGFTGSLPPKHRGDAANNFFEILFDEGLFKGILVNSNDNKIVSFNCKRVGRLSRERALGLLMAYTSCLSRPAFDREFG